MKKSILVIDTPKNCEKCILCSFGNYRGKRCVASDQTIFLRDVEHKPDWCPLQDMPKKYENVSMNFECGYNACVDEILGENR